MNSRGYVCIFAKPPQAGSSKTRLAPLLGKEGAAALAVAFLEDTCSAVQRLPWAKSVVASAEPFPPGKLADGFEEWPQGAGDLGARIESILSRALGDGSLAIALGADSPGLPLHLLERARAELETSDAVIGPAEDGGFYLLGLKQCPPGLLGGISWSQSSTFSETFTRLRSAGLRVVILDRWFDVDRPEDLAKLRVQIASGKIDAPATQRMLKELFPPEQSSGPLKISVVLPVLNERECLPGTLAELQKHPWVHEIIVADGGSTDGTREWLGEQSHVRVVETARGKGVQMNAGAKAATGNVLLFLHADCVLPADAGEQLHSALRSSRVVGGCFFVRFDAERPWSLRLASAGINWRTRRKYSGTGDQAIFVRREVFERAGGCPDWPLFEDVELARRIKRQGEFAVVRSPVTISSRRYVRYGVFRTACLIYALRLAFWAGVSPVTLKKWFDDVRPAPASSAPGSPANSR